MSVRPRSVRRLVSLLCLVVGSGAGLLSGIGAARADRIILTTGELLRGEVVERTPDTVTLQHPILGRLVIDRGRVTEIVEETPEESEQPLVPPVVEPEGGATDVEADADAAPAPEAEAAAAAEAAEEKEWESSFDLGITAQTGNTENVDLFARVRSIRENDETRTNLDASYFYGESDGDRDTNEGTAGFIHDWFFPDSRWTWFVDGRYEYDEFEAWEHRISAHTGPGYLFIDEEDVVLRGRVGFGAFREFNSQREEIVPELLAGLELDWEIDERTSLVAATTLFPDLDDTGEYRIVSSAGLDWLVAEESSMSLTLGVEDEYQSKVDPGTEHNDLKVFGGLRFSF